MVENQWLPIVLFDAVLVSVIALAVAGACWSLLRKQAATYEQSQQRLEREFKVLESSALGMGKRLLMLERHLSTAPAAVSAPQGQSAAPVIREGHLQDAISLLNAGLSAEEVARRCGISKAEASLIKLMHSQAPRDVAA